MNPLPIISAVSVAAADYKIANEGYAFQLDGEQWFATGILASGRVNVLGTHIKQCTSSSSPWISAPTWVLMGMSILQLGITIFQGYCKNNIHSLSRTMHKIKNITEKINKVFIFILKRADTLVNVASGASYVALIVLGFPVAGGVGLAGLLLIGLKRYRVLPLAVDRALVPISALAQIVVSVTMPIFILYRVLGIFEGTMNLSAYVISVPWVRSCFPKKFLYPSSGTHVMKEEREDPAICQKVKGYVKIGYLTGDSLKVNSSYVYAPEVRFLFDDPALKAMGKVKKKTVRKMFEQLDAKIKAAEEKLNKNGKTPKITLLTKEEAVGYAKLKDAAITGKINDKTPTNIALFQQLLKTFVNRLNQESDPDNFKVLLKDFAISGFGCAEGWLRDLVVLYNPKKARLEGQIHQRLALHRGEMIKEAALEMEKESGGVSVFSVTGKNNDIHLSNALQVAMVHRIQSLEGLLHMQVEPLTWVELLFFRKLPDNTNRPFEGSAWQKTSEAFHITYKMAQVNPGLNMLGGLVQPLVATAYSKCFDNANRLVDGIYDDFKEGHIAEKLYKDWVENNKTRFGNIDLTDPIWTDWIESPDGNISKDRYIPSKQLVSLILWDMGILERTR